MAKTHERGPGMPTTEETGLILHSVIANLRLLAFAPYSLTDHDIGALRKTMRETEGALLAYFAKEADARLESVRLRIAK